MVQENILLSRRTSLLGLTNPNLNNTTLELLPNACGRMLGLVSAIKVGNLAIRLCVTLDQFCNTYIHMYMCTYGGRPLFIRHVYVAPMYTSAKKPIRSKAGDATLSKFQNAEFRRLSD
jgi:hypothetical protein